MTCPYCHLYAAQNLPCDVCSATATVDKPRKRRKSQNSGKSRKDNATSWLSRLHEAGMPDDTAICEGLATGAVVQAIGWQANYLHAIDYLESRGYAVAGYRYRIVCGSRWA